MPVAGDRHLEIVFLAQQQESAFHGCHGQSGIHY